VTVSVLGLGDLLALMMALV
jgi:hypothetical protein